MIELKLVFSRAVFPVWATVETWWCNMVGYRPISSVDIKAHSKGKKKNMNSYIHLLIQYIRHTGKLYYIFGQVFRVCGKGHSLGTVNPGVRKFRQHKDNRQGAKDVLCC